MEPLDKPISNGKYSNSYKFEHFGFKTIDYGPIKPSPLSITLKVFEVFSL